MPPPRRALCETGNPGDHGALLRPDGTEHPARPGRWQCRAHVHSEPQAEDSQPTAVARTAGAGCGRTRPKRRRYRRSRSRPASAKRKRARDGVVAALWLSCSSSSSPCPWGVQPPAVLQSGVSNPVPEESQVLPSMVGNEPHRVCDGVTLPKGSGASRHYLGVMLSCTLLSK